MYNFAGAEYVDAELWDVVLLSILSIWKLLIMSEIPSGSEKH